MAADRAGAAVLHGHAGRDVPGAGPVACHDDQPVIQHDAGGGGGAVTQFPTALPQILGALVGVTGLDAPFGCQEEWYCTEWSECTIEGLQYRVCEDRNECGTTINKPPEVQECEYIPTCFDGIQNGDETGVDCGGRCKPCPGCDNGIRDPGEEGIDCGGPCRPCNSCFDGVQNYGETGLDCGGPYCPPCYITTPPILEFPRIICEKSPNPLKNDAKWFLLIVAILTAIRLWLYSKELKQIKEDKLLDDFKRAKLYHDRRREMILFILVVLSVCLLSYGYYYEFLLCNVGYQYLWLFLFVLILIPLVIYAILKALTYSDEKKLDAMQSEQRQHEQVLQDLLVFENEQLLDIEKDVAMLIEDVATNLDTVNELRKFPELREIYENIVRLYDEYHKNKTPTGIEKALCDEVYAVETNEEFKTLAKKHPMISLIYQKLSLLYHHYEEKQRVYDQLDALKEQNKKKVEKTLDSKSMEEEDVEGGEDWEAKGEENQEEAEAEEAEKKS